MNGLIASQTPREGHLLLVDDSEINRTVLRDQLQHSGYMIETASCGSEAVDKASSEKFDCILMDLQMPDMDGIEAMKKIREKHVTLGQPTPPVVALTAHVTAEYRELCLDSGMNGFVTKPVAKQHLVLEIERQMSDENEPESVTDIEPDSEIVSIDHPPTPEGDSEEDPWRERMKSFGGNRPDMVISICDAFIQEVPVLVKNIDRCVSQNDAAGLRTASHTLKSCLKYVAVEQDVSKVELIEKNFANPSQITPDQVAEITSIADHWVNCVKTLREELKRELS